jgi:phytoene dehydrogenase-like protein
MVTGSRSGPLHQLWRELGVAQNFNFHYHQISIAVEGMGNKLIYATDRQKLEADMLAISPEDSPLISEFVNLIFGPDPMNAASLKPMEMENIFDKLKILPAILPVVPKFIKYKSATIQDFAARFKNPFLREAVRFFIDAPGWPMPKFPMPILSGFMRSALSEAGVPEGGSQKVVFHIAEMFKKYGGNLRFQSRVKNLIIENDNVKGILLDDGTQHRADIVIWAADGHTLIFDLLKKKYINEQIKSMYETWIPVKPIVHVMIGVNRDLSDEPHRIVFETDEPIQIAGHDNRWLTLLHHCFDKTMSPAGKSAVEVWYDTDYNYWEKLAKNRKEYEAEKQRIANYTLAQLEKRWPGFAAQVEVVDVPTPYTYNRYTGNWKGSPDGWYITPENMNKMKPVRSLPGLEGLYTVGQWTAPFTGTIIAALSGRQIIQLICKKEGKKFQMESKSN